MWRVPAQMYYCEVRSWYCWTCGWFFSSGPEFQHHWGWHWFPGQVPNLRVWQEHPCLIIHIPGTWPGNCPHPQLELQQHCVWPHQYIAAAVLRYIIVLWKRSLLSINTQLFAIFHSIDTVMDIVLGGAKKSKWWGKWLLESDIWSCYDCQYRDMLQLHPKWYWNVTWELSIPPTLPVVVSWLL